MVKKNLMTENKSCSVCGSNTIHCKNLCRKCYNKEYNQKHKEKIAATNKIYRDAHKEEIVASSKIYYKDNKTEILAIRKDYYRKNKETIIDQHKEYYKNNTNSIKDKTKKYQNKHPMFSFLGTSLPLLKHKHPPSGMCWHHLIYDFDNPESNMVLMNRKAHATLHNCYRSIGFRVPRIDGGK